MCSQRLFSSGSLLSTGGQNPVEPALLGKPVIFGPNMQNFAPIVRDWLANDAAIRVADESELVPQIERLLRDERSRNEMAARAMVAVEKHSGATSRVVRHLQNL